VDGPVTVSQVASGLSPARSDIAFGAATEAAVKAAFQAPKFAVTLLGQSTQPAQNGGASGAVFTAVAAPAAPVTAQAASFTAVAAPLKAAPVVQAALQTTNLTATTVKVKLPGGQGPVVLPSDGGVFEPGLPSDSAAAKTFRELAASHLRRIVRPPPVPPAAVADPGDASLKAAFTAMVARWEPMTTFSQRAGRLVKRPAGGASPTATSEALERINLAPRFPQPMVEALAELSQELVLPGLDRIDPNTIVALETDPSFVEAYLVGLNTEMGRELVWRGFPADLTATYFDQFWMSPLPSRHDIQPIAKWEGRPLSTTAAGAQFVVLIRGELLLRYPDAIVTASKGADTRLPVFSGAFAPDVRYLGFDIPSAEIAQWQLVIQEHPSAPQFGLDAEVQTQTSHLAPAGAHAAAVAQALRRKPVRLTLPPSLMASVTAPATSGGSL
jgi:hypothetical protein